MQQQGWRDAPKIRTFSKWRKNGDTSSLKCFSNTLISGVSGYAKMSVSKQSVPYCEGWRCQASQLCRNSSLGELYKSNLENKIFVKLENIYQVGNAFAGIVRDKFSLFDYLITKIFLGLDIFAETRVLFKTYVKIHTNVKYKSVIFPRGSGEKPCLVLKNFK